MYNGVYGRQRVLHVCEKVPQALSHIHEPATVSHIHEPATARSRTIQVPPIVSKAFPVAKTLVSRAESLPKVKRHQLSPRKLV